MRETVDSGNADAVNLMHTDDAVAVWEPGCGAHRKDVLQARGGGHRPSASIKAKARQAFVIGDTELLIMDCSMDVTNEAGELEHLTGVGVDVPRLGADGKWRYAIDDQYGEA